MAIAENTEGVGAVSGLAWTSMNGTGLNTTMLAQVNDDVAAAVSIAEALLEAANGAFNLGWQAFSLNDLAMGAALGERALLQRTDLQTTSADDTPADWAAFIARALPSALANSPDADETMSLVAWRRLAADLQAYAALQASRRAPSDNAWAAVTHQDGQWFVNGQSLSLLDLFTAVRVNQVANFQEAQSGLIDAITANNSLLAAAREWSATIRARRPTGEGEASITVFDLLAFIRKWGYDPAIFSTSSPVTLNANSNALTFDRWLNSIKAYVDLKDTENQTLQVELTRKADRQAEVLEAMVSFANKSSKTGNRMAGNLG